jgi:hypothetical protein
MTPVEIAADRNRSIVAVESQKALIRRFCSAALSPATTAGRLCMRTQYADVRALLPEF